ncbi:ABC transporter-related protein [Pyrolobus fumarii 1A]|uniref:Molybdate/tungstate import ATP-binding protein WtpC n=1 Tax=Pyrolobus fumarii (strain DSM 11204 / 1A) TaxID=694429 RepID=G0EFS6_PYRF1|nr:ABC transporter ATP-binding protein [Pyrolobus fumarii]AEM38247.1 ABC transporter-related protein [Pyrolobus fumarii 1A]
MAVLRVESLVVERSGRRVLDEVSFVHESGILVVLGPNGAGKTTLLKSIAGLVEPSKGVIEIGDIVVYDSWRRVNLPPEARRVGYVPQSISLFPHMTVYENLVFAARKRHGREAHRVARMYAELLGIEHLLDRKASQLSGGEAQKAAIARALASDPALLLLDEPFSNIDAPSRDKLRVELRRLLVKLGKPTVIVTHSFADAWIMGDAIVLLRDGRIVASGAPSSMLRPRSLEAARFLGFNLIPATLLSVENGIVVLEAGGEKVVGEGVSVDAPPGSRVYIAVKGDDVILSRVRGEGPNWYRGVVVSLYETRYGLKLVIEALGAQLNVETTRAYARSILGGVKEGLELWLHLPPDAVSIVT